LSDNGSSYIAGDLANWREEKGMDHVRGAPLHPQTQGKIERWHQTLKNRILLENYDLPGDPEQKIGDFVVSAVYAPWSFRLRAEGFSERCRCGG
jgi:transposase InsO family protein